MSSLLGLALLFLGMAIGSISPLGFYGFIGFIVFATLIFIVDMLIDMSEAKRRRNK